MNLNAVAVVAAVVVSLALIAVLIFGEGLGGNQLGHVVSLS